MPNIQLKIGVLSILPKLWLENIAIIVLSSLIIFLTKNNNNLSEIIPLISLYRSCCIQNNAFGWKNNFSTTVN